MEAGDRFNKDEIYKMPLTVFDVIRIQKLSGESLKENEARVSDSTKDERHYKEVFCTLSDLF